MRIPVFNMGEGMGLIESFFRGTLCYGGTFHVFNAEQVADAEGTMLIWFYRLSPIIPLVIGFTCLVLNRFGLQDRMMGMEGDLPSRLADGTIRLISVTWLLRQAPDFIMPRRQELPEEAFVSSSMALSMLRKGLVGALSYRWLTADHPDPKQFHLKAVLEYLRQRGNGQIMILALFWDFASLPQKPRTDEEATVFAAALKVMAHLYAHSSTLVIQHARLPAGFPSELPTYETSGWCTFESACSQLAIEGGGRLVVLGTGRVKVRAHNRRTPEEMSVAFNDETLTRFVGRADRDSVAALYKVFYEKVVAYDQQRVPFIVKFGGRNWAAMSLHGQGLRVRLLMLMLTLFGPPTAVIIGLDVNSCVTTSGTFPLGFAVAVCIAIVLFAPARELRAKVALCSTRVLAPRNRMGASVSPKHGSDVIYGHDAPMSSTELSYDKVHDMGASVHQ